MRWVSFSCVASWLVVLAGCGSAAPKTASPKSSVESKKEVSSAQAEAGARAALKKGDWARAQSLLSQSSTLKAKRLRAELLLLTGRYDELASTFDKNKDAAVDLILARGLRRRGKLAEAKHLLKSADTKATDPTQLALTLLLGEILLEEGKRPEAEAQLMTLIERANQGRFDQLPDAARARAWGVVGQAAHHLRSPEDANEAFNDAEAIADADLDLLLARGELFLEKFDFANAGEVLADAQKIWPTHPDVRLLEARLALRSSLAFAEVEKIAQDVLETNPQSTQARFLLAGVALRDLALDQADQHLHAGLQVNPRDLQLLSMKAAVRFLAEDPVKFDQTMDHILELSPGYSEAFRVVGEYAEWEHRYPDIEKLMRRAVRLDRDDGQARALLGLTLVRAGSDAAGLVELNRAFDLDPYNVRVLNTLDLYENIIPRDYVEKTNGPFQFRFPKKEAPLLERYVPALLEEAYRVMKSRYDYTPRSPIGIEIYEERSQFAVRTGGLPQTAIAGVCFGRKLATMSPIGSPGNLGMTLWHELAHVFHIGLSKNRVPRWLTEGLAEWETVVRDVGWSREMDLELHRALTADELPSLGSMSRAFTHARRMQDVANAYYASGQIAEWIVATHGEDMARDLVAEFGAKKLPPDVVPQLLGASFAKLDRDFRAHARNDLARFDKQFVSQAPLLDLDEVKVGLKRTPKDRDLRHRRAMLHLADGEIKKAESILKSLLKDKYDPQIAFTRARLLFAQEKKKEARALLKQMIEKGDDGYEVRMILARLGLSADATQTARKHLEKASELDPLAVEPLGLLAVIVHKSGDEEKELDVLRRWAKLAEHDPMVHRALVALLLKLEKYDEAKQQGELAVWVDLAGFETHRLYGKALARNGDISGAEFEFESALLCPSTPEDITRLSATWSEELERAGRRERAKKVPELIAKSRMFSSSKKKEAN